MYMRHWKKAVCLLTGMAILFTYASPTEAAMTNESIQQKEAEIAEAKKEVSNLKSNLTDVEKAKLQKKKHQLEVDAKYHLLMLI